MILSVFDVHTAAEPLFFIYSDSGKILETADMYSCTKAVDYHHFIVFVCVCMRKSACGCVCGCVQSCVKAFRLEEDHSSPECRQQMSTSV